MTSVESTRFIFDTSGLLGVLEPDYGDSTRTIPGRKLSQMARLGMVTVPPSVINEAGNIKTKTDQWLSMNDRHIQVPPNLQQDSYSPVVQMRATTLPGCLMSNVDIEGVSVALALTKSQRESDNPLSTYIVVHDIAYEAACILLGVATVRPEAFVEAFAALPLPDDAP